MSDIRVKTRFGWKDAAGTDDGRLKVTGGTHTVMQIRRIAAAGDYAAEDVLSDSATDGQGTAWEFNDVGSSGQILKAMAFIQTTALAPRLTLYLFSRRPTSEMDDNAANVAPSLADWRFFVGQIDFSAMEDLGGVSSTIVTPNTYGNLPLLYSDCANKLYGIVVTRDAITGETANDFMGIRLELERF